MSTEVTFEVVVSGFDSPIRLAMNKSEAKCRSVYDKFMMGDASEEKKSLLTRDTNWLKLVKIVTDSNGEIVSEEVINKVNMQGMSWWEDLHNTVYSDEE